MMDELELLKKDWQKREADLPKLSYDQIYKMIWKKSSSIVKWIFYISILEFIFWAGINIIFNDPDSIQELKDLHIHKVIMVLNVVNYAIILYFIYKFYTNYKKISFTDSSKKLMSTILKVKRTVTQYVWFNLIIFTTYLIINMYGVLLYGPEGKEIVEAASQDGNSTAFWAMVIAISVVFTAIILFLIWLFYKLLYGILLKRLRENYNELKKLEI
ncbi:MULTISPECIES: hypothetical protein [Flagellimonas]|uniref:Uncharacterized protein n=2 Tax=Flagellimonas TaxID=444459 RepID=A0A3A1NM38_9FLAO|nr:MULTISPECIES: hypothetical protein [Allomuricauda]RIV45562.1 hypothetical protein D2V05_06340 [Allomuricauda maritima]RIV69300.1 hypothetical protein D2U88_12900 [Allomuricauda aequoris]TXJ97427.1 hypothetical protein FQ017_06290 [Allomuricauda maritima]TXK00967.1 hypothetical protein FQ019_12780 [Allomuricauda aequoris]